jgi:hypothetical protein
VTVTFIDRRAEQRRRETRCAPTAIVHPDLDRVDLLCSELSHRFADLGFARHLVCNVGVSGSARPRIGCTDTAPGDLQACAADPPRLLIGAHAIRKVAFFDALRHDRADAEVQRALQVRDDILVCVVLRRIRELALEAGMHVRADQRRHHGLPRQIDAARAGRQGQLTAAADVGDDGPVNDERSVLHRRRAVAGNHAGALVEDRRTALGRAGACAQQAETGKYDERAAQHGSLPDDAVDCTPCTHSYLPHGNDQELDNTANALYTQAGRTLHYSIFIPVSLRMRAHLAKSCCSLRVNSSAEFETTSAPNFSNASRVRG